jgi:hypothetical protein
MNDNRFPRAHLTARNRRYPEGGWVPFAVIVAALLWTLAAMAFYAWVM